MSDASEIWVLTDGRAGNEAQALGLAEAVARIRTMRISSKPITLKRWAALLPPGLLQGLRYSRKGWPFSGLAEGAEQFHWPWPDLVIGAGRRSAPVVAAIRELNAVAAVQLLNPKMKLNAFDAVVVPQHDGLAGANVLSTLGAVSRLTAEGVKVAADAWRERLAHLRSPRLAVMIGGPSKSAQFGTGDERTLCLALETLQRDYGLLVTTSRRTSAGFADKLRGALGPDAFVWSGEGDNPYPAILGLADAVLVTEDSVNMASEAASTGLPVHVFPVGRIAPKMAAFHEALVAHGASRRFRGEIGRWAYTPLAEADRIAADLVRRGIV